MKHSTERILTTHAGRLDGPPDFQEMMKSQMMGGPMKGPPSPQDLLNAKVSGLPQGGTALPTGLPAQNQNVAPPSAAGPAGPRGPLPN